MSENQPTEDTPYVLNNWQSRNVLHTRRCGAVTQMNEETDSFRPATERQREEFDLCKLCQRETPRGKQRTSYAKQIQSGRLEVNVSEGDDGELQFDFERDGRED